MQRTGVPKMLRLFTFSRSFFPVCIHWDICPIKVPVINADSSELLLQTLSLQWRGKQHWELADSLIVRAALFSGGLSSEQMLPDCGSNICQVSRWGNRKPHRPTIRARARARRSSNHFTSSFLVTDSIPVANANHSHYYPQMLMRLILISIRLMQRKMWWKTLSQSSR